MFGASEHKPIESALVAHLHLPLVSVALALVLATHVTAESLTILEGLIAKRTDMFVLLYLVI